LRDASPDLDLKSDFGPYLEDFDLFLKHLNTSPSLLDGGPAVLIRRFTMTS